MTITYHPKYIHVVHAAEKIALRGLKAGIPLQRLLEMSRHTWRHVDERGVAETVIRAIYMDNGAG